MKHARYLSALCLLLLFLPTTVHARCNLAVQGISFVYDVFSTSPATSTNTITVYCDDSPAPDITIRIGKSANSGGFNPRSMKHTSLPDLLNYNLFTAAAMDIVWGDGTGGSGTVLKTNFKKHDPPLVLTVYGKIPPGQDVSSGTYSETLSVTVDW